MSNSNVFLHCVTYIKWGLPPSKSWLHLHHLGPKIALLTLSLTDFFEKDFASTLGLLQAQTGNYMEQG